MRIIFTLLLFSCSIWCTVNAQEETVAKDSQEELDEQQENSSIKKKGKIREIHLNMTSLLTHVMPLGNGTTLDGPFGVTWLRGQKNQFFRISLGMKIVPEIFDFNNFQTIEGPRISLGVGYTSRKELTDKIYFDRSFMLMAYGGGLNYRGATNINDGSFGGAFGLAPGYKFNDFLRLTVETLIFIGIGNQDFVRLVVIPPVGLNLVASFQR